MVPAGVGHWKRPEREDMALYEPKNIIELFKPPNLVKKRNMYTYWSKIIKIMRSLWNFFFCLNPNNFSETCDMWIMK